MKLNSEILRVFSEQEVYQQALSDFYIEELLEKLSNYSDADFDAKRMNLIPEELESLASTLLMQFIKGTNGKLISGCLNAIRYGDCDLLPNSVSQEVMPPLINFPINFPNGAVPGYSDGTCVKWKQLTKNTDWGIIIGRFYAYASHISQWSWKYVVLLDKSSPSSDWIVADTAWEEDLEEVTNEK